jgi:hypothetical protein
VFNQFIIYRDKKVVVSLCVFVRRFARLLKNHYWQHKPNPHQNHIFWANKSCDMMYKLISVLLVLMTFFGLCEVPL